MSSPHAGAINRGPVKEVNCLVLSYAAGLVLSTHTLYSTWEDRLFSLVPLVPLPGIG